MTINLRLTRLEGMTEQRELETTAKYRAFWNGFTEDELRAIARDEITPNLAERLKHAPKPTATIKAEIGALIAEYGGEKAFMEAAI